MCTREGVGEGEGGECVSEGVEEDYYFCEPETGRSGWDPPQLRECLAAILRRDGFVGAAQRICPALDPMTHSDTRTRSGSGSGSGSGAVGSNLEHSEDEDEDEDGEQEEHRSDNDVDNAAAAVNWEKLRENLSEHDNDNDDHQNQNQNPPDLTGDEHHNTHAHMYEDHEEYYYDQDPDREEQRGTGRNSQYPSSVASTKSRRSQKWQEIKQYQRDQKSAKKPSSVSTGISKRNPAAITQQSVRTLAAGVLEDNEKVHVLLMELREVFALKRGLVCNFLFSNDNLDASNPPGGVYPQESVNSLLRLGTQLAELVIGQPGLVVRAIAALEQDYNEVDLIVYIVLHRVLHPFSSDNSYTTALLLEALNFQIEHAPWDPEDDTFAQYDTHSAASTALSFPSRVQRHVKLPVCTEQHSLLCMLLLGVRESKHIPFFWKPLFRPFLRDYTYAEASPSQQANSNLIDSSRIEGTPAYQETVLTSILKSYGMRRDVSLFYRMVWRHVLPAIAGAVEGVGASTSGVKQNPPTSNFSKLISLASRIIESAMLDDVSVIFPATATAVTRCLAETCGKDGMYTYLLNYLILPNLVKLLLGDNDCAENEDVYKQPLLSSLTNKYFNYHEWWPSSTSFVENKTSRKIVVADVAGVLIWCVWRIFTCAIFTQPSELTTFTAAKFFSNIGINETYTEVADTRIRNVVSRMRLKIQKGCQCLLQLPLDVQGSEFLEEVPHGAQVKVHTKVMGALLNKRIRNLMLKPPEMLNAIVISRQDSIVLFDALAFVLEAQQAKEQRQGGPDTDDEDGMSEWYPLFEVDEVLEDVQEYLSICDSMDEVLVDAASRQDNPQELDVEDVLLLWSDPVPRDDIGRRLYDEDERSYGGDDGNRSVDRGQFSPFEVEREFAEDISRPELSEGDPPDFPPPHMLPPYPYEDAMYHSLSRGGRDDGLGEGNADDYDDDFLDDVTMFSDIPPPPDGPAVDTVEYQHDQLLRGASLQQRYISSLVEMLRRTRANEVCNLTSLLANDAWFYSPEVDISHRLAMPHNNMYDKCTSSSLVKSKPNSQGALLPRDISQRGMGKGNVSLDDYTGLATTQKNFFNSLRFSDARPRANTRTSIDINVNRNAPRLVNNMIRESLITKHDPDQGFHADYEKIYHASHGRRSDNVQTDAATKQRQHKPRYTKVTLPENSSLLVPTVSLCCKPASRQPHGAIHKSYINSLRAPDSDPSESDKKKKKTRSTNKNGRSQASAISPSRPLVSFPEHLRGRVRGDPNSQGSYEEDKAETSYYEHQRQSGKNNFHGHENRMRQYSKGKYRRNNSIQIKARERKMPTPLHGSQSENLFSATISHSLKLEYDDDFEITAAQERGWMAQLRSWEAMDTYQGRVIAPVLHKPFFPSGHVEPVRLANQQPRIPGHLTPGNNRRNSRRRSIQANATSTSSRDWFDYDDENSINSTSQSLEQGSPPHVNGQYESYDDYLRAESQKHQGEQELERSTFTQQSDQSPVLSPFPAGSSNLLANTLNLLRSKSQAKETQPPQEMSQQRELETSLSSAGTRLPLPQKNEDPVLQEATRQTESVLERLRQRLDKKKSSETDEKTANDLHIPVEEEIGNYTDTINNDPQISSRVRDSTLASTASKLLEVDASANPLPRPEMQSFSSTYSLSCDGGPGSPRKEYPRRRDSDPNILSQEQEERNLEEFTRHQEECEALSPTELRRRMIAKGRWEEPEIEKEEVHLGNKESTEPQQEGSDQPTSPARTASMARNNSEVGSAKKSVPLISTQHSMSNLAKREQLMSGFEVMKYADVGYGKKKHLSYEPTSQELRWRPISTSVFSRLKGPQESKSIKLEHITEVRRGVESAALRKAGLVDPLCCLCVVTNQEKDSKPRALDVVFKAKGERDAFVRGLEIVLQASGLSTVIFL